MVHCEDLSHLAKYRNRNSPPANANSPGCRRKTAYGNDGDLYTSTRRVDGIYYWKKEKKIVKRRRKSVKTTRKPKRKDGSRKRRRTTLVFYLGSVNSYRKREKAAEIARQRAAAKKWAGKRGLAAAKKAETRRLAALARARADRIHKAAPAERGPATRKTQKDRAAAWARARGIDTTTY